MQRVAKTWRLLPHDAAAIDRLAKAIDASPVIAQLLLNRGVSDAAAARTFLDCPLTGLRAPDQLPGASAAADRLWRAAQDRQRITIYGDYDVDGVSGTAILLQALQLIGADADYYVPNRLEEGYGLNAEALRQLAAAGTKLVVTVDCGICSCHEAAEARALGIELIITDHHEFRPELPDADILVHPRLPGHPPTYGGISGAGVAFKVAWLLCQRACGGEKVTPRLREYLLDAVALAALGLVADVVPLQDENRIYVRHGVARLQNAPTPGMQALRQVAQLSDTAKLRAEDIAFRLAPRLNAAGRLGCARLVVDLLTTPSAERARDLAQFLESQNQQRQQLERRIVAQAREQIESDERHRGAVLVLASPDWHAGVIGIVAGRLADTYGRPALVIAQSEGVGVGSGRSIPGFALHEALAACGDVLIAHGGHAAAAGFRVDSARIDELRSRFVAYAEKHFPAGPPAPELVLDAELPLSALTTGLIAQIDKMEPYGAQNPRPRFLASDLQLVGEPKKMGGGERHLSFRVRQGGSTMRVVAWNQGERADELTAATGPLALAFTPRLNTWNGYTNVELEAVDFRVGEAGKILR